MLVRARARSILPEIEDIVLEYEGTREEIMVNREP